MGEKDEEVVESKGVRLVVINQCGGSEEKKVKSDSDSELGKG